mmetsp:Transcript_10932/g.16111  ORF Transcript_10932/g.16111 Transcript_10932/m.16111 type:complete len:268 (-) Transcript_10932:178-981(-)
MKVSLSLSSQFLLALACISYLPNLVAAQGGDDPIAEASERCTNIQTPALGCLNDEDPPVFTVTYPDVNLKCKFALTLEQSAKEPTVSLVDSTGTGDDDFYTIMLVDTADSFVHPILHYGASNVRGSDLAGELVLADANPFSGYRGPSPPKGLPGTESLLANYEWIVAKQEAFVEASDLPVIENNIKFGYEDYLADVKGNILSAMYFSSGYCVDEIKSDAPVTSAPVTLPPVTLSPVTTTRSSATYHRTRANFFSFLFSMVAVMVYTI